VSWSRAQYNGRSSITGSVPAGSLPCARATAAAHSARPWTSTIFVATRAFGTAHSAGVKVRPNVSNPLRARISPGAGRVSRCSSTVSGAAGSAHVLGGGAAVAGATDTSVPTSPRTVPTTARVNDFTVTPSLEGTS
jgi:hypothetical protein